MRDLERALKATRPSSAVPLDVAALQQRSRQRRTVTRAAVVLASLMALGAGAVLVQLPRSVGIRIGPAGPDQPAVDRPEPTPTPPDAGAEDSWAGLSLDQAIDRLIAANREAPARPVPGDGEVLVDRSYGVWLSSTVSRDGTTNRLELTFYERLTDPDGNETIVRAPLASRELPATAEELRWFAEQHLPVRNVDRLRDTGAIGSGAGPRSVEEELAEAERDSHGRSRPAPGATQRPEQAHAFIRAADALRSGLEPDQRIQALKIIDRLDRSLVAYRGSVRDLRGRPGVGIAGRDPDTAEWSILIFDPANGDLLGELGEVPSSGGLEVSGVVAYTSNDTFVEAVS